MVEKVDARGLSCPQPVLLTLNKLKAMGSGEVEVLVDNETSKENVTRAASAQGWSVTQIREDDDTFIVSIAKR
ncbi:MAG: sulfurtransferase TusA family protein [Desulfomonilaceae bacterium]